MPKSKDVVITSPRWGKLKFTRECVIEFPHGLLGFEEHKRFGLFAVEDQKPFLWLISLEQPELAFVIIDPRHFQPDYDPKISPADLSELRAEDPKELNLYAIVTLSKDPTKTTANLSGPLVVNPRQRLGKQIVLLEPEYPIKFKILKK